ncbi:hypothetical protein MMPV_007900 [Pyropia vietnamensis]
MRRGTLYRLATAVVVGSAVATAGASPSPVASNASGGLSVASLTRDGRTRASCAPAVEETFAMAPTPLHIINEWLATDAAAIALRNASEANLTDCHPGGDELLPCYNAPAIGSGAASLGHGWYVGLTDRGPNQDCEDLVDSGRHPEAEGKKGKGFPVPAFSPSLIFYKLHRRDGGRQGSVRFAKAVPLTGSNGQRVSGLPNTDRDDTPYGTNCAGNPLPYDVGGVDPEDVAPIPHTRLLVVVEEYAPSVMVVSAVSGTIVGRYVPKSVAPGLKGAPYPVIPSLPSVFADRRKNRGFESLSVAPSGTHLYAVLQSPLGDKKAPGLKTSTLVRGLKMSIHVKSRDAATLTYESQFALEASGPAAWTEAKKQPVKATKIKLSAATAIGDHSFVLLERAPEQVRLFRVDVAADTTNLDDTAYAANTSLEAETGGTRRATALNVTPAQKRLLWDSAATAGWAEAGAVEQQEGVVVDHKGKRVLLVSDNDFGIEDGSTVVTAVTLGRPLDGCTACPSDVSGAAGVNVTPGSCPRAPPFKRTKSAINVKKVVGKESCWGVFDCMARRKEDDDD